MAIRGWPRPYRAYPPLATSADLRLGAPVLGRIARLDSAHRSYAFVLAERARARAKVAEAEIGRGIWRSDGAL